MDSLPKDWTSANVISVYKKDHCIAENDIATYVLV